MAASCCSCCTIAALTSLGDLEGAEGEPEGDPNSDMVKMCMVGSRDVAVAGEVEVEVM